jgi:hypothetical protein
MKTHAIFGKFDLSAASTSFNTVTGHATAIDAAGRQPDIFGNTSETITRPSSTSPGTATPMALGGCGRRLITLLIISARSSREVSIVVLVPNCRQGPSNCDGTHMSILLPPMSMPMTGLLNCPRSLSDCAFCTQNRRDYCGAGTTGQQIEGEEGMDEGI